jgi:hypothetical protein
VCNLSFDLSSLFLIPISLMATSTLSTDSSPTSVRTAYPNPLLPFSEGILPPHPFYLIGNFHTRKSIMQV